MVPLFEASRVARLRDCFALFFGYSELTFYATASEAKQPHEIASLNERGSQ